jgi:hypothetical protein
MERNTESTVTLLYAQIAPEKMCTGMFRPRRKTETSSVTMMAMEKHTSNRKWPKHLFLGSLTVGSGVRKLDDDELDSGDDEDRRDRVADTIEDNDDEDGAVENQVVRIYPSDIGRMGEPEPGDGEVSRRRQA